jgi:putative effector of murein hydrolase
VSEFLGADGIVFSLGAIVLTVGAYRFGLAVRRRWTHPLTTPVLFSTAIIVAVFVAVRVDIRWYEPAKNVLTFLLGPATVALAIPLYRHRAAFARELVPALTGLTAGILVTMSAAILCARAFGLGVTLEASLSVKSATAAIAIEAARIVHGDPALAAGFVVCTGVFGAALGPWILDRVGVKSEIARGISLGGIAHGIGTAQAATESEFSGAVAGVALGIGAVLTSLAAPVLVQLLAR